MYREVDCQQRPSFVYSGIDSDLVARLPKP